MKELSALLRVVPMLVPMGSRQLSTPVAALAPKPLPGASTGLPAVSSPSPRAGWRTVAPRGFRRPHATSKTPVIPSR